MNGIPLPDEMLCEIVAAISDNRDLEKLCQALPEFERICGPSKPLFLMEMVFPLLLKYLSTEDILNLRTVCRDWLAAVDTRLQRHPNLEAYDPANPNLTDRSSSNMAIWEKRGLLDEIRFSTVGEIRAFIAAFAPFVNSGRNMIPCRSVSFEPRWDGAHTLNQFWTSAIQFLHLCGKDIWYIEIEIYPRFQVGPREFYDKLREALVLLPNLRALEVVARLYAEKSEYSLEQELEHCAANPLPVLDKLEFLLMKTVLRLNNNNNEDDWVPFYEVAPSVNHVLLKTYSRQLKRLSMFLDHEGSLSLWKDNISASSLGNLTELNIKVPASDISNLLSSTNFTSLSKLTLNGLVTLDQVFRMIHDINGLEVLAIRDIACFTPTTFPNMTFSSVKALKLDYHKHIDYGFLRSFNQLQYLEVELSERCTFHGHKKILFDSINNLLPAKSLYSSRIWFILPKLKQLLFQRKQRHERVFKQKTYTREGFEYLYRDYD